MAGKARPTLVYCASLSQFVILCVLFRWKKTRINGFLKIINPYWFRYLAQYIQTDFLLCAKFGVNEFP